jgi:ankyrin repeat protein
VQLLVACRARVNDLDVDDETALVRAVKNNQLSTMRFLLESGATMRTAGTDSVRVVAGRRWYANTPLVLAAERDYTDAAMLLLMHGADVDAPRLTGGLTPLQTACKVGGAGRYAMAKVLLAHGADVRKIDSPWGRTALCWATVTGDARLVKMLVRHKASLHHVDGDQCTPLAIAARLGRMDVALVLLKCRADVRRGCTTDGRTPLQIAHENGNYRLARLFAAATGEPYEVDPAMPDGIHQS